MDFNDNDKIIMIYNDNDGGYVGMMVNKSGLLRTEVALSYCTYGRGYVRTTTAVARPATVPYCRGFYLLVSASPRTQHTHFRLLRLSPLRLLDAGPEMRQRQPLVPYELAARVDVLQLDGFL